VAGQQFHCTVGYIPLECQKEVALLQTVLDHHQVAGKINEIQGMLAFALLVASMRQVVVTWVAAHHLMPRI
jgi:hypothetical protein